MMQHSIIHAEISMLFIQEMGHVFSCDDVRIC